MSSFEDIELQKLNQIIQTFTPTEMNKYKEEVEYIKYLLNLLKKQKSKPQTKKQKEAEKKTEKKIKEGLSNLLNMYSLKKPTDITHAELPENIIEDANIAKLSTKYYKDPKLADDYLFESKLANKYEIDTELSDSKGIVVKNKSTGKVKVGYRGTDKKNLNDLDADVRIGLGTEQSHNHFIDANKQMKAVIDKYGISNIDKVVGYSLGGTKSYSIGKKYNIDSTSLNAWIAGNNISEPEKNQSSTHEIWRTQDDIASFQAGRIAGKNNTTVNVVETNFKGVNPYKSHMLENFTTNDGRDGGKTSNIEAKARAIYEHSLEHGEMKALHDMIKVNQRTPIKITETGTSRGFGLMPPASKKKTNLEKAAEKLNTIEMKPPTQNENKELNYDESLRFLEDYNQDGSEKNIEQQTTSLEERAGLIRTRAKGSIRRQTADLEERFGLTKKKNTLPKSTEIELQNLKSSTLFPPAEKSTPKIRRLQSQTTELENQIEDLTGATINNKPNAKSTKKSYTDYITENNIRDGSHKKSLWEISGGKLTDAEKLNEELFTFGDLDEVKDFASKSTSERESQLKDMADHQTNLENDLNRLVEEPVHIASAGSFSKGVAAGLHPTNLLIGLATDKVAGGIIKQYIEPVTGKQSRFAELGERGALAGGLSSFIMGSAAMPEIGAGVAGYEVGDFTASKVYSGLKSVGAGEEVSEATADTVGGIAGGTAAAYTGSVLAGLATTGLAAEEGAALGSVFMPGVGTLVGGAVGSLVGLGGYFYSRFKH